MMYGMEPSAMANIDLGFSQFYDREKESDFTTCDGTDPYSSFGKAA